MKIAKLSDIHTNFIALKEVIKFIVLANSLILLRDLIDYGSHFNEVIELIMYIGQP